MPPGNKKDLLRTKPAQIPPNSDKIRQMPTNSGKFRQIPTKSDKIRQNPDKIRQNPAKSDKIRQNPTKSPKIGEKSPKIRHTHVELFRKTRVLQDIVSETKLRFYSHYTKNTCQIPLAGPRRAKSNSRCCQVLGFFRISRFLRNFN